MYVIERLWWDNWENRNADGYEVIGFVRTKAEADRICALDPVPRTACWSFSTGRDSKEGTIPRYRAYPVADLTRVPAEVLVMMAAADQTK